MTSTTALNVRPERFTHETRLSTTGSTYWLDSLPDAADSNADAAGADSSVGPLDYAKTLARSLLAAKSESSGATAVRQLHALLQTLDTTDRQAFQDFLATDFAPEPAMLRAAADAYLAEPTATTAAALAQAADPPRQELLRRMNMAPGGTRALVDMRKDIAGRLRSNPELKLLDRDLKHLFTSWFNRGFLELRRIDWQSPAAVLEKLIGYEAVHEIHGWGDLRRRLAPDRRCFAFFHPALPDDPLIFVEVALVDGLAGAVQPLLIEENDNAVARDNAARAYTAIFYSISNCQNGLRGISFGNFLIKQVVEELKGELPNLTQFSTLSPVPGFRRWLTKQAASTSDPEIVLLSKLQTDSRWPDTPETASLRPTIMRLCADYLTRPASATERGDPVAHFHLGNGASLERINWFGNTAPRGLQESFGMMVNYLYDLDTIESNHEAFEQDGTVVRSEQVDALLAQKRTSKTGRDESGALIL